MPIALVATWPQVRAWRLERQCLSTRLSGSRRLERVASATCGVHAQMMSAAELQFGARMEAAKYRVTTGTVDDITDVAKGGMLPLFKEQPGFISYGVADCGDGSILSISHWETHGEAETAAGLASDWVAANIADRIQLLENNTGDYVFLS